MRTSIASLAFALTAAACAPAPPAPVAPPPPAAFPAGPLVDLTHTYEAQSIFWPTADPFRLDKVADGMTPAGYYYASNNFFSSEHGGTHMDAPVHFAQGSHTADQVPLDRLVGPALVIDVTEAARQNADYQVTVADLQAWEQQHGQIEPNAILLIRTGFSQRWPDAARYLGTAERGPAAVPKLHFPGLHPDAAKWIVASRPVRALGIDTASIDYGQSSLYESHRALYATNIPAFENLTALEQLPLRGASIVALPMKIKGGSGAPLRAIAILPAR
ncbi:MAG: cyclase family protein [Acidobacteria bacterium]|nr:cyclase family protein [Acidobacteriota bacterium]